MKRWLVRLGIPLGMAVALLSTATVVLGHWMSGSSAGTVYMGAPTAQKQATATQSTTPVPIASSYFASSLPLGFSVKRQAESPNTGTVLLQLAANTSGGADQQVGITIGALPAEGLADLSSYHLRTTDSNTYTRFTPPNLPGGAVAFRTAAGQPAITLFWPRGAHYAEVSISTESGTPFETLLATYRHIVDNWDWKS